MRTLFKGPNRVMAPDPKNENDAMVWGWGKKSENSTLIVPGKPLSKLPCQHAIARRTDFGVIQHPHLLRTGKGAIDALQEIGEKPAGKVGIRANKLGLG